MPVDEHPGSTELVELAEASLALGDPNAALQLLAQVDAKSRDNYWTATQVEALRSSAEFDKCLSLINSALEGMVIERDWPNARRLVLECGRIVNDGHRDLDSLEHLHNVEVMLRSHQPVDPLLAVQLCSMIASRIVWEGDVTTASRIVGDLEFVVSGISDRRALANYLWVTSEIDACLGDLKAAISSMKRVIVLLQEENDVLAHSRAVSHLAFLAGCFIDVDPETLEMAHEKVSAVLDAQPGDQNSLPARWLTLLLANLTCVLGEPSEALRILGMLEDQRPGGKLAVPSDDNDKAFMHEVRAMCEVRLGNPSQSKWHLDQALCIYDLLPEQDAESRRDVRRLAHIYFEIGEVALAQELIEQSEYPQVDLSSYLPKIAFG